MKNHIPKKRQPSRFNKSIRSQPIKRQLSKEENDTMAEINYAAIVLFELLESFKEKHGLQIGNLKDKVRHLQNDIQPMMDAFYDGSFNSNPIGTEMYIEYQKKYCKKLAMIDYNDKLPFMRHVEKYKSQKDKHCDNLSKEFSYRDQLKEANGKLITANEEIKKLKRQLNVSSSDN